jgi:hypothetical protein
MKLTPPLLFPNLPPGPEVPHHFPPAMNALLKLAARRPVFLGLIALAGTQPLRAALDLKIDVNQRSATNNVPANTESGFTPFAITSPASGVVQGATSNSITVGAQTVTITGTAPDGVTSYDDRKRTAPVASGTFTQTALLQDFIFAGYNATSNVNAGLDIAITGLEAGKSYAITVWSFDSSSAGTRVSDWSANGELKVGNYTFGGGTAPTTNERYQMNFLAAADGGGQILISARRDTTSVNTAGTAESGVFLNALRVFDYDTDNDQMYDDWEVANGLVVGFNDAALDPDNDTSTNLDEFNDGTDPHDPDTDGDSLPDGRENKSGTWGGVNDPGTDPLKADTDGDGLGDAVENPDLPWVGPAQPGTNPNISDADGDTFADGDEAYWQGLPLEGPTVPDPDASSTLAVDFDHTVAALQPGFVSLPGTGLAGTTNLTGSFGSYTVTVTAAGTTTIDSRDRTATAATGGFTPLFQDFIFSPLSDNDGDGMDVTITGLAPLTWYPVTLWSWDPTSAGTPRHSTWLATDGDNGPVVKVPRYILAGATPLPSSISQRRMKFDALTDSAGTLLIQGRKENGFTGSTINVFLNGLFIGPPVSPLQITAFSGSQITFTSEAGGVYEVRASRDLLDFDSLAPAIAGLPGTASFTDTAPPVRRFYQVHRLNP